MRPAMSSRGVTSSQAPPVASARERTNGSATALPTPTVKMRWPEARASATAESVSHTSPSVISSRSRGMPGSPSVR